MTAQLTLYAPKADRFQGVGQGTPAHLVARGANVTGDETHWRVEYPDVSVTFTVMPEEEIGDHLLQFQMFLVRTSARGVDERLQAVLNRVQEVQCVIGVVVEPDHRGVGKVQLLLEALVEHLGAMVFTGSILSDERWRPLASPSVRLPEERPAGSPDQQQRAERSKEILRQRQVPMYGGPLFVDDVEEAEVRSPAEVARRVLVLWITAMRGEGAPAKEMRELLDRHGLWETASPKETEFLRDDNPDPGVMGSFVWRVEAIEPLLWALGRFPELEWPRGFCNVKRQVEIMRPLENDPTFITTATLRPVADLLDAQDLTFRQHWAIRDAYLAHRQIPADLDWSGSAERVDVRGCPVTGVVAERHRALNWLLCFGGEDCWDDVDTPT